MPSIFTEQVSQTKLLASLILFVITLLCGYLPVRIILNQNYIQYAMFAGGGVLMATAFCHLIPEAHDNYRLINLQIAQTAPGNGGVLTELVNTVVAANASSAQSLAVGNSSSGSMEPITTNTTTTTLAQPLDQHQHQHSHIHSHSHSHIHPNSQPAGGGLNVPYLEVTLCCGFFFMYLVEQLMVRFINNHTHEHPCDTSSGRLVMVGETSMGQSNSNHKNHHHVSDSTLANGGSPSSAASATSGTTNIQLINGSRHSTVGSEFYKFIRGLLIVSAFGAHSIFDGVAIGSQETVEKVWTIFLAISCHKLIIAAVVGLELYAATLESHLWTLVHLSIFSVMSPIGILLVIVAQNSLNINSNHPAMILLQSFATGTLLYIVFVEILQPKEEQAYEKNKLGKSVSLIAGFGLMLMVLTFMDH